MKSIAIVEDEALIADHLALILEELGYTVHSISDDWDSLNGALSDSIPEIVLMDINLSGDLDGVDIATKLKRDYTDIAIVFVSSNIDDRSIARVKMMDADGFIAKPFNKEQIATTIKLLDKRKQTESAPLMEVYVKDKSSLIKLSISDLYYLEAADNYAILYHKDGRYVQSSTLKDMEHKLSHSGFIRVHRSYVVNLQKIDSVHPKHLLIGDTEIPVSESFRAKLLQELDVL